MTTNPERVGKIIALLKDNYSRAKCSLHFSNPFELLVATMLSAQCTDERVNKVTPELFRKFGTPGALAKAKQEEIETLIRSTGFFRNKAKNLIACAKQLIERHCGEVPNSMEELSVLPGVGRKTANVVLGNAFGIPGMVVDTHVFRLSHRLGLIKAKTPEEAECQLEKIIPKKHWINWSHWLIYHGRSTCVARRPKCTMCFLVKVCPQLI